MRPEWDEGECAACGSPFPKKSWNAKYCASHRGQADKDWKSRNREKINEQWRERYRENGYAQHIARKYGVSMEWYEERAVSGCEVCGRTDRLVVDHDHGTGEARGVLCNWCNVALGNAQDDPEILRKIAEYIERFG